MVVTKASDDRQNSQYHGKKISDVTNNNTHHSENIDFFNVAMTVMISLRISTNSTLAFKTLSPFRSPNPHNHQLNRYKNRNDFCDMGIHFSIITGTSSLQWLWFS